MSDNERPDVITRLTATNQRLADLVRYMRQELHTEGLITNEEYAEILQNPGAVNRLGGYDVIKAERDELRTKLAAADRGERQKTVAVWCAAAFGVDHAASIPQRAVRLLEDAIEAYQAAGCELDMAHRLVDHVFAGEPGQLHQEIGGVGTTLLALAAAANLSADEEEEREVGRVLRFPLGHFRARNEAKNAAGFRVDGIE